MNEPAAPPPPAPATGTVPPPETAEDKLKRKQFYLSVVSSVVLILGGFGSVYQYLGQQKKLADDQIKQQGKETEAREKVAKDELTQRERLAKREIDQREKEAELRRREIALMVYREKKEAYGLLVDAATAITTARNRREVEDLAGKFYGIYYGRVHIIPELDIGVQRAKNAFKDKLDKYLENNSADPPLLVFNSQLNEIAEACRKGLDCRALDGKHD